MNEVEVLLKSPIAVEVINLKFAIRRNKLWLDRAQISANDLALWMLIGEIDSLDQTSTTVHGSKQLVSETDPNSCSAP